MLSPALPQLPSPPCPSFPSTWRLLCNLQVSVQTSPSPGRQPEPLPRRDILLSAPMMCPAYPKHGIAMFRVAFVATSSLARVFLETEVRSSHLLLTKCIAQHVPGEGRWGCRSETDHGTMPSWGYFKAQRKGTRI